MFAFVDTNGNVLATAGESVEIVDAQARFPSIVARIDSAPASIVPVLPAADLAAEIKRAKSTKRTRYTGHHVHTSGDGSDPAHYSFIEVLDAYKAAKIGAIDAKTVEIFSESVYEYPPGDENFFPLTIEHQSTMNSAHAQRLLLSYPFFVSQKDDLEPPYAVTNALSLDAMHGTLATAIEQIRADGLALKESVRTAASIAEVDAVDDNR